MAPIRVGAGLSVFIGVILIRFDQSPRMGAINTNAAHAVIMLMNRWQGPAPDQVGEQREDCGTALHLM